MAPPIKRPLPDPKQFYAYVWRLDGEVIWVGHGHNHRGRPLKSNTSGRPNGLAELLITSWDRIEYEIRPCASREEAISEEVRLTKLLAPRFNVAIGFAGFAGHQHTAESLELIKAASTGRPVSDICRIKSSQRATARNITNPPRKGKKCSEEHKRKMSEARKLWWAKKREGK